MTDSSLEQGEFLLLLTGQPGEAFGQVLVGLGGLQQQSIQGAARLGGPVPQPLQLALGISGILGGVTLQVCHRPIIDFLWQDDPVQHRDDLSFHGRLRHPDRPERVVAVLHLSAAVVRVALLVEFAGDVIAAVGTPDEAMTVRELPTLAGLAELRRRPHNRELPWVLTTILGAQ